MLRLLGIVALINLLLLLPLWLRDGAIAGRWLALEAVMLFSLLALMPAARLAWWRPLLALVVLAAVLAGLGDAVTHRVLGRPLNLYLDLPLLRSVFHLLQGSLGTWPAWGVTLGGTLFIAFCGWALNRGLRAGQRQASGRGLAGGAALLLVA
ncbi:MAG: alkaline phosphatase, partial [Halomonas sp.]